MAVFAGTTRNRYTSEKIRNMRSERKSKKAAVDGVSDKHYQQSLGDLMGAGHLRIVGFENLNSEVTLIQRTSQVNTKIKRQISFDSYIEQNRNERPHVVGYLASGHPKDPTFKIKGWFNDDGTLRIELVKSFELIP
jgi:hypothetical protein